MSFPPPLLFCFSSTQQSTTLNSTQLNWIALEKRTGGQQQQQQQRHCHHPSDILTDILDYCFKFVFFFFLLKKKAMAFVRETLDGAVQCSEVVSAWLTASTILVGRTNCRDREEAEAEEVVVESSVGGSSRVDLPFPARLWMHFLFLLLLRFHQLVVYLTWLTT